MSAAALSVALSGCVQSSGTNARQTQAAPASAVAATSDPLELSGVAYTQGDAMTPVETTPPPTSDVIAEPAGRTPNPVVSATPLPPTDPALTMTPVMASPPATVAETDGFPNINIAPKQPQGKLLTPEERAKLIEELNALAGRSGGAQ